MMARRNTIAALLCLAFLGVRSESAELTEIIIDTDAGIDDALAILLVLAAEERPDSNFKVVGITCVYGNTYLHNVEQNVLKVLTIANRTDIPVYSGAQRPLLSEYVQGTYFGNDGLGDVNFTEKITAKVDRSKYAPVALVDYVKRNPGKVKVLSLGPLTNSAIATSLHPSFQEDLKGSIILGGAVEGHGNRKPNVEFNFGYDAESNFMVLNSTNSTPCTLFPWETFLHSDISKEWRINVLGKRNSRIVKFMNHIEEKQIHKGTKWAASDVMAAAVMLYPRLIVKSTLKNVTPVTDGAARGSLLVDYDDRTGKPKNALIVQQINTEALKELLLELFS